MNNFFLFIFLWLYPRLIRMLMSMLGSIHHHLLLWWQVFCHRSASAIAFPSSPATCIDSFNSVCHHCPLLHFTATQMLFLSLQTLGDCHTLEWPPPGPMLLSWQSVEFLLVDKQEVAWLTTACMWFYRFSWLMILPPFIVYSGTRKMKSYKTNLK